MSRTCSLCWQTFRSQILVCSKIKEFYVDSPICKLLHGVYFRNMTAQIEVPAFLGHLTCGVKVVNVKGKTVGECLNFFVSQFPGTKELLFDRDHKLLKYIDVYINGASTFPEELGKSVHEGDTISLLYLIVGG